MPESSFIPPAYGGGCFADIPPTILSLFTGAAPALARETLGGLVDRYDAVVLLYIDAFGWRFVEQFRHRSALMQRIEAEGVLARLTAQFPSTTAGHITSIHTGLPVGQSGVFEWHYYEPALDALIAPLLFSFAGDKQRETLKPTGIEPARLYPGRTFYQTLQRHGVRSTVLQHREYTASTFSQTVLKGARVVSYATLPEALVTLRELVTAQPGPAYYFLYFDRLDNICHHHGPPAPHVDAEIDVLLMTLEQVLFRTLERQPHRTLVMITSDHGQVEVNPKTTVYLNRDPRFEGYQRFLKTNRKDRLLVPAGSPRDMFLYIQEGRTDEALAFFADRLEGRAEVRRVRDLVDAGYFGPLPVCDVFLARAGDLVILPYAGETVWWYEQDRFEQKFRGHHGGLTRAEMEIPFMLYALGSG
jgi:predicted AlkP superfamily pyrophosphatase or phosphodiesterase